MRSSKGTGAAVVPMVSLSNHEGVDQWESVSHRFPSVRSPPNLARFRTTAA